MDLNNLIVGNAAGLAPSYNNVDQLCFSDAITRVTTGPVTILPREENRGKTYGFNAKTRTSANSKGLPSIGLALQKPVFRAMHERCQSAGKKLRVSIAGFSMEDWPELVAELRRIGITNIELNFGCPNVWTSGVRKPIPSYDPDYAHDVLQRVKIVVTQYPGFDLGVKISPVTNEHTLSELLDTILGSGIIREIVGCNTDPDQDVLLEDGSHALAFYTADDPTIRHLGGAAGAILHTPSIRIHQLLKMWAPQLRRIACGGIFTGVDLLPYLESDVTGFECGTGFAEQRRKIFSDIAEGLGALVN